MDAVSDANFKVSETVLLFSAFLARRKGFGLACGLGHSAALTVHRTVIHYRSAFESLAC